MKRGLVCLLLTLCWNFAGASYAQEKKPEKKPLGEENEIIKVDTQLVDVPVLVTDRLGKPILNLKQTNFVVFEDGKRQEVTEFAATTAPFEVALLLDTSGSTRADLQLIQRAAQLFIDSLRPGDRVSIIAYRSGTENGRSEAKTEVLNFLTDDRAELRSALAKAGTSNGTPYYDSLLQVVDSVFANPPSEQFRGRRALVALTDGVDSTSASDFEEAKEKLEQAGIVAYFIQVDTQQFFENELLGDCETAIRFSTAQIRRYYRTFSPKANIERASSFCQLGDFERLAISKKLYEIADSEMRSLAKASGGKVFPVGDLSEARGAFRSVAAEIGTKYSLGYYSSNDKRDGTYRRIKVELKGLPAGSQVRAREGYTAPTN